MTQDKNAEYTAVKPGFVESGLDLSTLHSFVPQGIAAPERGIDNQPAPIGRSR